MTADPAPSDGSIVIVGASLAGWRATETLREEGFSGSITLVGEELHLPYDRPPLSKKVLAGTWPPEKTVLADPRRLDELRVRAVLGHRAVGLDVAARRVELDDGSVVAGDGIVLATGASPRHLAGTEALGPDDGLFTLRTLDDSLALRRAVHATEGCRVIVIGAGFIGAEVASTCAELGCAVRVVEAMEIPLSNVVGPLLGSHCASFYATHGIELRCGVGVVGIARVPGGLAVELGDGAVLESDVVVVGIGVVPAVGWLEGSGLTLDNGIGCDDRLFAADGVVAAGDAARWTWHHDARSERVRIEHWQVAADAGVAAAKALLAGRTAAAAFTPVPYFWSDQFGIRLQVLGHPVGTDDVEIVDGSFAEGKLVALFGRGGRLAAVLGISRPRKLMGYRPLLEAGCAWDDALAFSPA